MTYHFISIFSPKSAHYFTKLLKDVYKIAWPYIFHRIGPRQLQSCVNLWGSLNLCVPEQVLLEELCLGKASVFTEDVTEGSRPLSEVGYWATEHRI